MQPEHITELKQEKVNVSRTKILPPESTCMNALFSAWNLTNLNLHESVFPPSNICERHPFVLFAVSEL